MPGPTAEDVRATLIAALDDRGLALQRQGAEAAMRLDGVLAAREVLKDIDGSLAFGAFIAEVDRVFRALRKNLLAEPAYEACAPGVDDALRLLEDRVIAPARASGDIWEMSPDLETLVLSHQDFLKALHANGSLAPVCGVVDPTGDVGGHALVIGEGTHADITARGALAQLVRDTRGQLRDQQLRAVGVFFHGVISEQGYRIAESETEANAILGWLEDANGQAAQMSLRYARTTEDEPWRYQPSPQVSQGGPLPMLVSPSYDWFGAAAQPELGAIVGADLTNTHALVRFEQGPVLEFDLADASIVNAMPVPEGHVVRALSAAQHQVVVTEPDGAVAVRLFPSYEDVCSFNPRQAEIRCVTMDPDGWAIVAGLASGHVSFFDLEGRTVSDYPSGAGEVIGCAISRDAKRVFTSLSDGTFAMWGLEQGSPKTQQSHTPRVTHPTMAMLSDTGRFAAWAVPGGRMEVVDFEGGIAFPIASDGKGVVAADITGDGQFLLVHFDDRTTEVWDTVQRCAVSAFTPDVPITTIRFAPDGNRVLCGQANGALSLIRLLPR